jgi:hypothetical protein
MVSAPDRIALGRMDIECPIHTCTNTKTASVLRLERTDVVLVRCDLRLEVEKPVGRT